MSDLIIQPSNTEKIERDDQYQIGSWHWIDLNPDEVDLENIKRSNIGCVLEVGSNYVKFSHPTDGHSWTNRIHFDNLYEHTKPVDDPERVIELNRVRAKGQMDKALGEVQKVYARLGVSDNPAITDNTAASGSDLAVISGQSSVNDYEKSLVRAKQEQLPALFKEIKEAGEEMAIWMSAIALPMKGVISTMDKQIYKIDDKIFSISLYAGLVDGYIPCSLGEPAPTGTKLKVMQRRLYMDEECLLNYTAGGMEFDNIYQFNDWLSEPENRDRILPFPRCIVSMQVRRHKKDYARYLPSISMERLGAKYNEDEYTYLYVRNGDNVYCFYTQIDFDEILFPDQDYILGDEPMMVKRGSFNKMELMTVRLWEEQKIEWEENEPQFQKWEKDNPDASHWDNPYYKIHCDCNNDDYVPLNDKFIYFDDVNKDISDQVKKFNRIALIIQGIFDRTEMLHPHPPIKTWTVEGFNSAIDLVYDGKNTLYDGDKPDIKAYIKKCNESADENSVFWGQDTNWQKREAVKENNKRAYDYNGYRGSGEVEYWMPDGDAGPGDLARPVKWMQRAKKAVFTWYRERLNWRHHDYRGNIRCTIAVPIDDLFNVSAYKIGDYKQFFQDPRSREEYMKWAPMLLAAEDYHGGKAEVQDPIVE